MKLARNATLYALMFAISTTVMSLYFGTALEYIPGRIESADIYVNSAITNVMHFDANLEERPMNGYLDYPTIVVKYPMFGMLASIFERSAELLRVPMDDVSALYWTSRIGLFWGFLAFYLLTAMLIDERAAKRVLFLLAFSPFGGGYTWLMAYPETWDLLFFSSALIFFYREEYSIAGIIMGFGAITRPQSIALVPILGLSFVIAKIRAGGWKALWETRLLTQFALLVGPGLLTYSAWMMIASDIAGAPMAPIAAQQFFGRTWRSPWMQVYDLFVTQSQTFSDAWLWQTRVYQVTSILIGLIVTGYFTLRRRFKWEIALYTLVIMAVTLASGYTALSRYALVSGFSLAFVQLPPKFDKVLIIAGIFFAVIMIVFLMVGWNPGYFP